MQTSKSSTSLGSLALLFSILCASAAPFSETLLGTLPALSGARIGYAVSQSGSNVATVRRDGADEVAVSFTGTGEKYDRILARSLRWVSDRLVYVGQRRDVYFLVDGGKTTRLPGQPVETAIDRPLVTPDGSQYVLFITQPGGIAAWRNGNPSRPAYDRMLFVPPNQQPQSVLLYATQRDCIQRVIGPKAAEATKWTVLSGIFASKDARNVFAWGEIQGKPTLAKNGKVIANYNPHSARFTADPAGQNWIILSEESGSEFYRTRLLFNGTAAASCECSSGAMEIALSATNAIWAWVFPNDELTVWTLKMRDRADTTLTGYAPGSFRLSPDGTRTAWHRGEGDRAWVVNGTAVVDKPSSKRTFFAFGPGDTFAYVGEKSGEPPSAWVTTQAGAGNDFEEVSDPEFTAQGAVVYTAKRALKRFLVVGKDGVELPVDEVIKSSIRISAKEVSVIGHRNKEFRRFTIPLP